MGKKKKRSKRQLGSSRATRNKYSNNTLVSVILITETADDDSVFSVVKNVVDEQTYKKIDLIISTFRDSDDCKEIIERCSKLHLEIRWIFHEPDNNFIEALSALAEGEVVFYKTTNNILWYPRHIQLHLETYNNDNGYGFCLSRIEQRNLNAPQQQYATLSWRIANVPEIDSIIIDEISHIGHVETDWGQCLREKEGKPVFYAGLVLRQWIGEKKLRGGIPDEISVIEWKPVDPGSPPEDKKADDYYGQIGIPQRQEVEEEVIESEEGLEIKSNFPTIVGNYHHAEYSDRIMELVNSQDNVESIAIKRTMGMGDVILVEPIIKKLREKYENATITLYTAKPDIVKYFKHSPDKVEDTPEDGVVKDILHDKPEQVKIDLDLSYESRQNCQFIDAYARVAGVSFSDQEDRCPQLICAEDRLIENNYVIVGADGSGWPGKTWPIEKYAEVVLHLQSMGYEVYETGYDVTEHTNNQYHSCKLEEMVNLMANCEFYIGADNGPMHIARSFDKPCVAINGAALTYLSNPNRKDIIYVEDATNEGYGIKHRTFFNLTEQGLTFVPLFKEDPSSGLNNIEVHHVIESIDKLFSKHNDLKFSMNISGTISQKDTIPGFAYYEDSEGNYHREDPSYHPDQRINISMVYEEEKDNIWKNNFGGIHNDIKSHWNGRPGQPKILDVGCNMGIFLNGMNKNGYSDMTGYDINRLSIDKGKEVFDNLSENLIIKDFTGLVSEEEEYDIILASDVISYVGSPEDLVKNVIKTMKPDGICYINSMIIDSAEFTRDPRGWPPVGNGEHITLFTSKGLRKLLNDHGLIEEEYGEWETQEIEMVFWKCRKE